MIGFKLATIAVLALVSVGLAVVEAMASGVPVLISDRVNIWREVETDGAGMVTACDFDAVAEALTNLISDRERLDRMGAAGRKSVARRYNWDKVAVELEAMYRGAIDHRPSQSG